MVMTLIQYNRSLGLDPDSGASFTHSNRIHFLLFDSSSPTSCDDTADKINSPIIEQFKCALETSVQEYEKHWDGSSADKLEVYVHVIKAPVQSQTSGGKHCIRAIGRYLRGLADGPPKRTFSGLKEQIQAGYEKLSESYGIDTTKKTRDFIYLLGDGEGALSALAVAQIISKVGILKHWAFPRDFRYAYDNGIDGKRENEELATFRLVRTWYGQVEVLGLWYDESSRRVSKAISDNQTYRGKLLLHNRDICDLCSYHGDSRPVNHMISLLRLRDRDDVLGPILQRYHFLDLY